MESCSISVRRDRSSSPTMCPSYPMTPRTDRPAARARVGQPSGVVGPTAAARQPDVDVDQHLGDAGARRSGDGRLGVDRDA